MWKKSDPDEPTRGQATPTPPASPQRASRSAAARAVIGPSIQIKGDITGGEDLLIDGSVEGTVELKENQVTIGKGGRVKADVRGRSLTIEGKVEGNLFGEERIVVRQSGQVNGNLTAPRVTLEDGATFQGSIDMDSGKGSAPGRPPKGQASNARASKEASSGDSTAKGPSGSSPGTSGG